MPVYLLVLMAGAANTVAVWPAVLACAVTFAAVQFLVSNFIGPELTAILASLASISAMVLLMKVWKPRASSGSKGTTETEQPAVRHGAGATFLAWTPYLLLVIFVLVWGYKPVKAWLDATTTTTIPGAVAAQHDSADAAGDGAARTVRGRVRLQLAERRGNGVPAGRRRGGGGAAGAAPRNSSRSTRRRFGSWRCRW